jgi:spore maturation protein CgeB
MKKFFPKKILLVVPEYSSFYPMMKQAFKELKIDHQIFDNRKTTLLEKGVVSTYKITPILKDQHLRLLNSRLVKKAQIYKPDLIVVIKGENIFPKTVLKLKKVAPIVNWFPDSLPNFNFAKDWLETYDCIFIGDNYFVRYYNKLGFKNIFHLPWAGIKIINIPSKKIYDIVFIGVHNPSREKMFLILKDLGLKIWGSPAWGQGKLANNYQGEWLSAPEILEILKKTKIVVNQHQNYHPLSSILNLRIYEATSCQALIITDYWSDLDKLYKVGKDLVVYKDGKDLKNKVEYFLKHENERKKIALSGYKQLNRKNTYNSRFKQMFSIISQNSSFLEENYQRES